MFNGAGLESYRVGHLAAEGNEHILISTYA